MKERALFLVRSYITTLAVFLIAKVVFMFAMRGSQAFGVSDVCDVLRHGFTLDLSTAFYFIVLPLLITIASLWMSGRTTRRVFRIYFLLIAVAFSLAFIADTALYPHWGYKLDSTCLQYLASPKVAAASVPTWLLVAGLLAIIALSALLFYLFTMRMPRFTPPKRRWPYCIFALVALPVIFIGMRGGIEESTTNVGQAYYSQRAFLNHSAVNPVFNFLSSFENTVRTDVRYTYYSDAECKALLDSIFPTESLSPDTLLRTQRPNIVIVMMESCGGQFTMISGRKDVTPNLNRMASEGIYFSECYANSFRTDRATVSIFSGYPSFPTMSLQKNLAKNAKLPGLARTLLRAGYTTSYYYGGDINFTKKGSYLINSGFEQLSSQEDYPRPLRRMSKWGVHDEYVLDRIAQEVESWSPQDTVPHLIGYNTLSSHEPWEVPHKALADPVDNAFHYLDHCVELFIQRLRKSPAWDNLLVILLPDHGVNHNGQDETSKLKMHIPMLWLGGAVREPHTVDVFCNQSDLAATLFGQLGLPHDDFPFSRDVLSQNYTRPLAWHTFNNGFSMVDSTGFFVYDLTAESATVKDIDPKNEENASRLTRLGKAILQETSRDLSER